jgi:hypothetical protein
MGLVKGQQFASVWSEVCCIVIKSTARSEGRISSSLTRPVAPYRHGCEIVSLAHLPRSTPQKHYFPASGTDFC